MTAPDLIDLVAGRSIGRPMRAPTNRAVDLETVGMVFAVGPEEVTDRIVHLHQLLGHSRQILRMDVGGMPQSAFLKPIELLGIEALSLFRIKLLFLTTS